MSTRDEQVPSRTPAVAVWRDCIPQVGVERRVVEGQAVYPPPLEQPGRKASYGESDFLFENLLGST